MQKTWSHKMSFFRSFWNSPMIFKSISISMYVNTFWTGFVIAHLALNYESMKLIIETNSFLMKKYIMTIEQRLAVAIDVFVESFIECIAIHSVLSNSWYDSCWIRSIDYKSTLSSSRILELIHKKIIKSWYLYGIRVVFDKISWPTKTL